MLCVSISQLHETCLSYKDLSPKNECSISMALSGTNKIDFIEVVLDSCLCYWPILLILCLVWLFLLVLFFCLCACFGLGFFW